MKQFPNVTHNLEVAPFWPTECAMSLRRCTFQLKRQNIERRHLFAPCLRLFFLLVIQAPGLKVQVCLYSHRAKRSRMRAHTKDSGAERQPARGPTSHFDDDFPSLGLPDQSRT